MEKRVEFVHLLDFLLSRYSGFLGWFMFHKTITMTMVCRIRVSMIFVCVISVLTDNMPISRLRESVFEFTHRTATIFLTANLSQPKCTLEFCHEIRISQSFQHFVSKNHNERQKAGRQQVC